MHDLSEVPWSIIESVKGTDDAVFLWESLYKGVADGHAPKSDAIAITTGKKLKHPIPSTTGKCTGS